MYTKSSIYTVSLKTANPAVFYFEKKQTKQKQPKKTFNTKNVQFSGYDNISRKFPGKGSLHPHNSLVAYFSCVVFVQPL